MERILHTIPTAVLYMDQDVYIKTDLPISIKFLKDHRQSRYVPLNEYRPHPNDESPEWKFTMYDRAGDTPGLSEFMPMPDLQSLFEQHPKFNRAMYDTDLFNVGSGWLELGHPKGSPALHHTMSFLHQWWAEARNFENGKWLLNFPWEQKSLSTTMSTRADIRAQTALLENDIYGSPDSPCLVHLMAKKKLLPEFLAKAVLVLNEKSVSYLDKLPATICNHSKYAMKYEM